MSLQFIADFDSQSAPTSPVLVTQWVTPSLVLTGHLDGYLRAWDALNGRLLAEVPAHTQSLNSLSATPGGDVVLTGSIDGSISLYSTADFDGRAESSSIEPRASCASLSHAGGTSSVAPSFAVALHPHRPIFASTGLGAGCSLHSADPSSFGSLLSSHEPAASSFSSSTFGLTVRFSPSGDLLALGTSQGHVHLHRLLESDDDDKHPTLIPIATITSHALPIRTLDFASDLDRKGNLHDDLLFVGGDDAIITAYDVRSHVDVDVSAQKAEGSKPPGASSACKNPVAVLMGHKGPVTSLCAVPSLNAAAGGGGPRLLSSASKTDGTVRIWDLSARPKAAVFVTKLDVQPSGGIDWRRSAAANAGQKSEQEDFEANGAASTAFVVSGSDGRARWYRLAGTGLDAAEERDRVAVAAAAAGEGQVNGSGEHGG